MNIPVQLTASEHLVMLVALIHEIRDDLRLRKHGSVRARIRTSIALHRKITLAHVNALRREHGLAPFRAFGDLREDMQSFRQRRTAAQPLALAA